MKKALLVLALVASPCLAGKAKIPPAPQEVRAMADQYAATLSGSVSRFELNAIKTAYIHSFFNGYINSNIESVSTSKIIPDAFKAGQKFREDNPSNRGPILFGFGYKPVNATGMLQAEAETVLLTPHGWVLTALDKSPAADSSISPATCSRVQVVGYISPPGSYGHMGKYFTQVLVYKADCLDGA